MQSSTSRGIFIGAIALFVLLSIAYSFSVGLRATNGASITGDEPFYLMTTRSLLDDGNLDLTEQYDRRSYESFFDHPDGLWKQSVRMDNGQILSPHEPGLSVLVIPGFVIDGLRGVQVQLMLIAALTFALAFVLTSLETGRPLLSWLATAAVGLSATAFVYSTEIYPEIPAALCLVASLLLIRSRANGIVVAIALAVILNALMWLGLKYAALAAVPALLFLWQAEGRARLALVGLGAITGAFYVWFHYAVFNDLTAYSVNTVYEGANATQVLEAHVGLQDRFYRLWGLFIDERFGIGRWAPVLLLVVPGLPLLAKQGRVSQAALAMIAAQVLIATFVAITMMGWWFPGRTLVVVLPLFPIALTLLVGRIPAVWRAMAAALGGVTLLFTIALQRAASGPDVRLAVNPFDMSWPPFRWSAALFPNYQTWTAETLALTVAWLAAFALAIAALGLIRRRSMSAKVSFRRLLKPTTN